MTQLRAVSTGKSDFTLVGYSVGPMRSAERRGRSGRLSHAFSQENVTAKAVDQVRVLASVENHLGSDISLDISLGV